MCHKEELDPDKIPQFGLIAEQVEKVDPDLIARDENGKPTAVRYEAVSAMLLNEFLREHGKIEAPASDYHAVKIDGDATEERLANDSCAAHCASRRAGIPTPTSFAQVSRKFQH